MKDHEQQQSVERSSSTKARATRQPIASLRTPPFRPEPGSARDRLATLPTLPEAKVRVSELTTRHQAFHRAAHGD
jgi:hypothetical protein